MATFTKDQRQLFFTACECSNVAGPCDIQSINIHDNQLQGGFPLSGEVNSGFWESQACISCDGRTLYFASNRPGGFGSTDIYVSNLDDKGQWSIPKNLGPTINTEKDEEAPFISNDGKTLFFSSTGHLGFGEQDIFMSRLQEGGIWSPVMNLGATINTSYRELGMFLTADGKRGLFSSDRPSGNGGMDIYQFDLSRPIAQSAITYVEGFVRDSVTKQPVQVSIDSKEKGAFLTDKAGRFFLCLESSSDFTFDINKEGYELYAASKKIPNWENKNFYPINILLKPKIVEFENQSVEPIVDQPKPYMVNIYFDFDNDTLNDLVIQQLEKFILKISSRKISRIEILGFADQQGPARYNLILSENRAKRVADFISNHPSIATDHPQLEIDIQGKGETSDQSANQLNRRVEIKVY